MKNEFSFVFDKMTILSQLKSPNLISKALELESCPEQIFHYGLFADPASELLPDAQIKFSQLVLDKIQITLAYKGRVLLCGNSLRRVAQSLVREGYEASLLAETFTDDPVFDSGNIEQLSGSIQAVNGEERFDLILIEGSTHYLDQLGTFSKSRELLSAEGSLIVFGDFLADDSHIERSVLANLSSTRQLAQRLGYLLQEEEDYSSSAISSLEHVCRILENNRSALLSAEQASIEKVSNESIDEQLQELSLRLAEFSQGRRSFKIFQFKKGPVSTEPYALAEYGDITSFAPKDIANLFHKSFAVEFDDDLWNWKYKLGNGKCVVAKQTRQGDIVAHYGGAPRKIDYFGVSSMAIQVCDVMVLPEIRTNYGKNSLFFKIAATFLEREIGNTVNHLLGFGFPNQKAMNIAIRLGLYEKTDEFVEWQYSPETDVISNLCYTNFEPENEYHQREIDELWQSMRVNYSDGIVGVRDWDYIKYRYVDHPFAKRGEYRSVFIRQNETSPAIAFAVLKVHEQRQLVLDLICPLESMKPVLSFLNQLVKDQRELQGLKMWITSAWAEKLDIEGAILNELGIEIPCNSWNPGPAAKTLNGHWWLTAGDMDFM